MPTRPLYQLVWGGTIIGQGIGIWSGGEGTAEHHRDIFVLNLQNEGVFGNLELIGCTGSGWRQSKVGRNGDVSKKYRALEDRIY